MDEVTTDFVRQFAQDAAPVFQQNHWIWNGVGVPTADDIEKLARELLEASDVDGGMSSGRIHAIVEPNGERRLELRWSRNKEILVSARNRVSCDGESET